MGIQGLIILVSTVLYRIFHTEKFFKVISRDRKMWEDMYQPVNTSYLQEQNWKGIRGETFYLFLIYLMLLD